MAWKCYVVYNTRETVVEIVGEIERPGSDADRLVRARYIQLGILDMHSKL